MSDTVDDLDAAAAAFRAAHGFGCGLPPNTLPAGARVPDGAGGGGLSTGGDQGATEGTVKNLTAEAIADITSSGETLRANHLKILSDSVILQSQATLLPTDPPSGRRRAACWSGWRGNWGWWFRCCKRLDLGGRRGNSGAKPRGFPCVISCRCCCWRRRSGGSAANPGDAIRAALVGNTVTGSMAAASGAMPSFMRQMAACTRRTPDPGR